MGLPSLATFLLNCPTLGIIPDINRAPIIVNNNDDHYKGNVERQERVDKRYDTLINHNSIPIGSTVSYK